MNELDNTINANSQLLYKNKMQSNSEKIINNTYYFYLNMQIADQCDHGEYYDSNRLSM